MKLVTAAQMSSIEQASVDAGVSLDDLMENAGLAVAEYVLGIFLDPNGVLDGARRLGFAIDRDDLKGVDVNMEGVALGSAVLLIGCAARPDTGMVSAMRCAGGVPMARLFERS